MIDTHVLLVPRWSGDRTSDFYPWLRSRVASVDVVPLQPTPDAPEIAPSVEAVRRALEAAGTSDVVLVGHSVGAQAAMRALATRTPGSVRGFLAVAGWWTVDAPWPAIQPWIDTPFDHEAARDAAERRVVLLSDDDPFTADHASTQRRFEAALDAEVQVHAGARHFNRAEEPAVLAAIEALVS